MRLPLLVSILLAIIATLDGAEGVRINVEELLRPETQLRAFQQFRLKADSEMAKERGWEHLEEFKKWHAGLSVRKLPASRVGESRILVVWNYLYSSDEDEWAKVQGAPRVTASARTVSPIKLWSYRMYAVNGTLIGEPRGGKDPALADGNIADLNGDSEPEIIERDESITDGRLVSHLIVRSEKDPERALFGVAYNRHELDGALAETAWDSWVHDEDGDGLYEIELGPVRAPVGIEPKVTFRWSKPKQSWEGPVGKPGDHFRVLTQSDLEFPASGVTEGLSYAVMPFPKELEARSQTAWRLSDPEEFPLDEVSRPYEPISLGSLSDAELLRFFDEGRTVDNYASDRMRDLTAVPEFWTLQPKEAAMEFVLRNRPPPFRREYLLSIFNPDNEAAPESGDLTFSVRMWPYQWPSVDLLHHLHCSPDGSFLAYAERIDRRIVVPPGETRSKLELRRVDLSYDEARHLLQTVWWMSRIRSRAVERVFGGSFTGAGLVSHSHASVNVLFTTGDRTLSVKGTYYMRSTAFAGVGEADGDYEPSAFLNVTSTLFTREVPQRLGERWKSQALSDRLEVASLTREQVAATKQKASKILQLYTRGQVGASMATLIAMVVGESGWQELRADVERVGAGIPDVVPYEKQLMEIDGRIGEFIKRLGQEAGREAFEGREHRAYQEEAAESGIPGLPVEEPVAKPVVRVPKDPKFAEVDALHRERMRVEDEAPAADRAIVGLRKTIETTLKQLRLYDDAEALVGWAKSEPMTTDFVLTRLKILDRKRATDVLRWLEAEARNPSSKESYRVERLALESEPSNELPEKNKAEEARSSELSAEGIAAQLALLRDRTQEEFVRSQALEMLVPTDNPRRYADLQIDDALMELLARDKQTDASSPDELPMAAARRLGSKAWDALLVYPKKFDDIFERFAVIVPALSLIAMREEGVWKEKLRELIREELKSSKGGLDETLWFVWLLDDDALNGQLRSLATRGPEDYESVLGRRVSNRAERVTHRLHRARHVLALRMEKDPFSRTRALLAFAVASADRFETYRDLAGPKLRSEIAAVSKTLTVEEKSKLETFARWCEQEASNVLQGSPAADEIRAVVSQFRAAL